MVLCSHKGAVAVRQPYIRVVGIEEANDANSRGPAAFTAEEVLVEIIAEAVFEIFINFSMLQVCASCVILI